MRIKVIYARGPRLASALIEAPTIKEAMRRGYAEYQWDSVLEATTPENKPLQSAAASAPAH